MASSSESEEDPNLKEALVPGFTLEAVKKSNSSSASRYNVQETKSLKSLRSQPDEPGQHFRGPDITPEHQKFIANKLGEFLDSEMKEVDILTKSWKKKPVIPEEVGGVRLLAESRQPISCEAAPEAVSTKAHKHKRREIVGEEDLLSASEKIQAAAVSPEWVLQGQGVFGKNCYRGEVITGAVHSWKSSKKS